MVPDRLLAFAGIHVIDPTVLEDIPASGFYDIIDLYQKIIASGIVINAIEVIGHLWTDIGTPQDYLDLHKAVDNYSPCTCLTGSFVLYC